MLMKVLRPSSIPGKFPLIEPTIIGNHVWPNSCVITSHSSFFFALQSQKTIPGYSIPPATPATFTAAGYGYSYHNLEFISRVAFTYSVALSQVESVKDSAGYTDIAKHDLPLLRFTLAASQINELEEAQDTSLELFILKCQVNSFLPAACILRLLSSSGFIIKTLLSLFEASFNLLISVSDNTSFGF